MQTLDEVIEIVQSANKIQLLKEKVKPIFEQMTYYKKEKNQIVSQIGDINRNMNVLISGILRLIISMQTEMTLQDFSERKGISA